METSAKGRASGASRVLRWVPDSLPLRFAALQASGKARLRVWAQLSPLLSRAHGAKRNATRDPRNKLPRSGAIDHSCFAAVSTGRGGRSIDKSPFPRQAVASAAHHDHEGREE